MSVLSVLLFHYYRDELKLLNCLLLFSTLLLIFLPNCCWGGGGWLLFMVELKDSAFRLFNILEPDLSLSSFSCFLNSSLCCWPLFTAYLFYTSPSSSSCESLPSLSSSSWLLSPSSSSSYSYMSPSSLNVLLFMGLSWLLSTNKPLKVLCFRKLSRLYPFM